MINIVIAAGYATRLYPLTENYPKPLLKVGSTNILERMLNDIDKLEEVERHIIVTNHKFAGIFEDWVKTSNYQKPITIVDDQTTNNENRLGAVGDLLLAINKFDINDDIMVVAADNILDFSFRGFVDFFKEKKASVIMCYHEPELKRLQRTGVIALNDERLVVEMQEKPAVPVSEWAVPPFYIYSREDLPLIKDCLNHGCGFDAPGNLAHYLVGCTDVYAWLMPGSRYDIGSLDSYYEAQEKFK